MDNRGYRERGRDGEKRGDQSTHVLSVWHGRYYSQDTRRQHKGASFSSRAAGAFGLIAVRVRPLMV
jgi:hypothetical protein